MVDDFKIILFTSPSEVTGEAEMLTLLLQNGLNYLHIRKPEWSKENIGNLIAKIPACYHPKIKLHDCYELAEHFDVGVCLNSRNTSVPNCIKHISKGTHSMQETADAENYDYVFISPVYDSISKAGYMSNSSLIETANITGKTNLVALGGVKLSNLKEIRRKGFYGGAILGDIWDNGNSKLLIDTLRNRNMRLYFITNSNTAEGTVNQAKAAIDAGCRCVQIRMKDAPSEAVAEVTVEVAEYAKPFGCNVIVDDHVEIAAKGIADGVHIGKNDMNPQDARKILGDLPILGYTANSIEDIHSAKGLPIDYLGIGPLRETTTKKNAAAPLGLSTYQNLKKDTDYAVPYVAIGSVDISDIQPLMKAGAMGVAVSAAIAKANDPTAATKELVKETIKNNNYLEWIS
ncbi:MAG: thiamine phosphate synthase [Muribaculaceae bacterium]